MDLLYPLSVLPRIAARGTSLTFDRAGRIAIPTRLATPTIAGSFVGEGMPIPVRMGQFAAQVLTPKKLGVITTWSKEAGDHSIPALEGLLRDAMQEDTAIAIDSVLLDANPATAIRPPGIFNGVTPITATAGGGINAMIGDFKNLVSAITAATHGRLRAPAWLMNPGQLVSGKLAMAASTGIFPFKEEMDEGNLLGFPIIDSSTVPLATVALIDCADFVMVGAEAPRLEISDVATIHEEDTNPLPISSPGAPATVAAPVRSLWQTDSLGLRLIQPLNWTVRRPGVVSVVQGVTW
jgi:HK97 family phage major capsid protein